MWRELLPAVQVAQRRIAEAVEQVQRNGSHSADAEVPFAVRADAAAGEGVRQDYGMDGPGGAAALQSARIRSVAARVTSKWLAVSTPSCSATSRGSSHGMP